MSLLSAISEDEVLSNQFVEGGVDATVFENFLYETLKSIRTRQDLKERTVVLVLDNARIHHKEAILQTAANFKAFVLFSAEYSPWLQPVEHFFGLLKKRMGKEATSTR
jgi:transposase